MKSLIGGLLLASLGFADSSSHVTAGTPTYVPTLPACGSSPFSIQQTATYPVTVWNCQNVGVWGGHVSATGTGYCPGGSTGGYCRINTLIAPTFQIAWQPDSTNTHWLIYIKVGSVESGTQPDGSGCAVPKLFTSPNPPVQAPSPTCQYAQSPIILDTRDVGFHLTDAAHGTVLAGVQTSWTDPKFGNGWLVRPNPDGSWSDMSLATNFFGNLSPQPPSPEPNGYRALAFLAAQQGCGALDHLDARSCPSVWGALRVWVDNGDGIVEPGEIHTLDQLGYTSISLTYHDSGYVDEYGNRFRYRSNVRDDQGKERERSFDVFLVTAPR